MPVLSLKKDLLYVHKNQISPSLSWQYPLQVDLRAAKLPLHDFPGLARDQDPKPISNMLATIVVSRETGQWVTYDLQEENHQDAKHFSNQPSIARYS